MAPVLGYWDIRGLASPIRYLLEYAGAEYTEKLYTCGPPPDFQREQWLADKFNLGLDFPNLPYYIDGDVKLTQSDVILQHLARKHGLDGKTDADKTRAQLLDMQLRDYMRAFTDVCYNPKCNELFKDYTVALPDKLKALTTFLGDRKFAVGDSVTYADFLALEYLEMCAHFNPDTLKDFPVLVDYHQRLLALEPIDKYFKSSSFIKYPFNGGPASKGGQYSDIINPPK